MVEDGVEVTVRPGVISKKTLRVTRERIEWGDRVIRLDRVEHVAHLDLDIEMDVDSFPFHMNYHAVWLADEQGDVTMSFKLGSPTMWKQRLRRAARGARALEQVIFGVVVPRLTDARLSQIQAGDDVAIGGREVINTGSVEGGGIPRWLARKKRQHAALTVVLNQHGIERRSRKGTEAEWSWSDIASATLSANAIWLLARDEPVPLLATSYCDAILLPSLIRATLRWRGQ
jgi:hypothetical protein